MSSGRTPTPPPNPNHNAAGSTFAMHTPPGSSFSPPPPSAGTSGGKPNPTSASKSRNIAGGLPPTSKDASYTTTRPSLAPPQGSVQPVQSSGWSPDAHHHHEEEGFRMGTHHQASQSAIGSSVLSPPPENNRYGSFVPSGLEEELHPLSLVATPLHLLRPSQQQQQVASLKPDFDTTSPQNASMMAAGGSSNRYRDALTPSHANNGAPTDALNAPLLSVRQSVMCAALGSQPHRGRLSSVAPTVLSLALSPPPPSAPSATKGNPQQQDLSSPYSVPPEMSPNGGSSSTVTTHHQRATNSSSDGYSPHATTQNNNTNPSSLGRSAGNSPTSAASGGGGVALEPFLTPRMPQGRYLMLNLLTTWGDAGEIGLNAIEVYDQHGHRIVPARSKATNGSMVASQNLTYTIAADTLGDASSRGNSPLSISSNSVSSPMQQQQQQQQASSESILNPLAEVLRQRYNVANLVNGVVHTTDEHRMYVTPYRNGKHHLVCIGFASTVTISAIRIFNYRGGGRAKTNKGARLVEMTVDDTLIFRGEIAESNGGGAANVPAASPEYEDCETILFTEEKPVLDTLFVEMNHNHHHHHQQQQQQQQHHLGDDTPAPRCESRVGDRAKHQRRRDPNLLRTSIAFAPSAPLLSQQHSEMFSPMAYGNNATTSGSASVASLKTQVGIGSPCVFPADAPKRVTSLCIHILSTWGDVHFVGLSGIRLRDPQGNPLFNVAHVLVNRPSGKRDDTGDMDCSALLDNDPNTACVWSFEPGLQIIIVFQQPVDLGFIEIANYSLGRKTYCGVKCARVFTSTMPIVSTSGGSGGGGGSAHLAILYASLWDVNVSTGAPPSMGSSSMSELTPGDEGITLRKSPATMTTLRFQSFDVSLASHGGGGGGSGAHSLRLSMNTRAAVAIRRARQSLLDPPQWLLDHQAYLPSILPVAYVFKVTMALHSRSSGSTLKHLLTAWASRPHDALTFLDDSGKFVNAQEDEIWCEGQVTAIENDDDDEGNDMTSSGGGPEGSSSGDDVTKVLVTLIFVSDALFAIAALFLRAPLMLCDDAAARRQPAAAPGDVGTSWVQSVRVFADDTLVYRGRDAVVGRNGDAVAIVDNNNDTAGGDVGDEHGASSAAVRTLGFEDDAMGTTSSLGTQRNGTVPSVVFFTLDDRVLQAYRQTS